MRLQNAFKYSVFEASKLVSTKTRLLKHYYRHQGNSGGLGAGCPRSVAIEGFVLVPGCSPHNQTYRLDFDCLGNYQRFRKGVGGRGLATSSVQNTAKMPPRIVSSYFIRGHRKKGGRKKPEFRVWEGFPCANPLCPPTPSRNF